MFKWGTNGGYKMIELEQILVLLVTILHLRHHNCTSDEKK